MRQRRSRPAWATPMRDETLVGAFALRRITCHPDWIAPASKRQGVPRVRDALSLRSSGLDVLFASSAKSAVKLLPPDSRLGAASTLTSLVKVRSFKESR